MIVCVCSRISDSEIRKLAKDGLSFEDIQFELGICIQCGACEEFSRKIIDKTKMSEQQNGS